MGDGNGQWTTMWSWQEMDDECHEGRKMKNSFGSVLQ